MAEVEPFAAERSGLFPGEETALGRSHHLKVCSGTRQTMGREGEMLRALVDGDDSQGIMLRAQGVCQT